MFDSFIVSILIYACEVSGFSKSKEIERIHLKFCKKILMCKMNTPTTAVYGELGRYPLYISRYLRILKYWFILIQSDNIIMQTVYKISYEDCFKGKKMWVSNVKKLLYDCGFNYAVDNQTVVNEVVFLSMFKHRIIDCFLQEWYTSKSNSCMLKLYHHVKGRFEYEHYLDIVPFDVRYVLLRL